MIVPLHYSVLYLMKSELDIQQRKKEILVQRHECKICPHKYFSPGIIFALGLPLSSGSPSIYVIMASTRWKYHSGTQGGQSAIRDDVDIHGSQRINQTDITPGRLKTTLHIKD